MRITALIMASAAALALAACSDNKTDAPVDAAPVPTEPTTPSQPETPSKGNDAPIAGETVTENAQIVAQ